MRRGRHATVLALVCAGLMFLTGTSRGAEALRVTIVQGPDPVSLDPTQDINKTSVNVQLGIFDPLVWVTPDGKVTPWIATSWQNLTPTTWRFRLRPGVRFHNGEPLTAENVVFSLETYNQSRGEGNRLFRFVESARVVDPRTVEIVTRTPLPSTPVQMGFLYLLPRKYYAEVGAPRFGITPVGTGPLRFREWRQGVRITLERYDQYWRSPIAVSQATYRPAPEAYTRLAMLLTGQAEIIANVPPELISRIEQARTARVTRTPSLRSIFLEFNMRQKPFDDVRVRRAVNYAIDKETIIRQVLGGNGVRAYGALPGGWLGANPPERLTRYDYDPQKARQLLVEAGYPQGFTFDFWHPVGRYLKDKEVAEAIAAQLAQIGMKSNLIGLDIGTLVQRIHTQTLSGLHMFSYAPLIFDTDYILRVQFWSKGLNQYAWDERSDRYVEAGAAIADPRQRHEIYAEWERYIVNDLVPHAFLYWQSLIYATSNKIDWQPRADEVIDIRAIRPRR
ncbi:MAG: ABC transporter substrate-binding protein [Armatimonadota bacterium]|nr:ABC transporter substrate-binding protein [Armatimonadota bacterium]